MILGPSESEELVINLEWLKKYTHLSPEIGILGYF